MAKSWLVGILGTIARIAFVKNAETLWIRKMNAGCGCARTASKKYSEQCNRWKTFRHIDWRGQRRRMRRYKKIMTPTKTITHIECDRCGKEVFPSEDELDSQEAIHFEFTGGFSSVFGDGTTIYLDLCQHCFKEVLGEYVQVAAI